MNSAKLNLGPPHGGLHWSEIEIHIQRGKELRSEAIARWLSAAWRRLTGSQGRGAEDRAEREDRAARRLRLQEFISDPAKGFFWPRLSWIAHEGLRLVSADERESARREPARVPPAKQDDPRPNPHRAIGG